MTSETRDTTRTGRLRRVRFLTAIWGFAAIHLTVVLALAVGRLAVIGRMGTGTWAMHYLVGAGIGAVTLLGMLFAADRLVRLVFRHVVALARYRGHVAVVVPGLVPVAALVAIALRSGDPAALAGMVASAPMLAVILARPRASVDTGAFYWPAVQIVAHGVGVAGSVLILVASWGAVVPLVLGFLAIRIAADRIAKVSTRYPIAVRLELGWAALLVAVGMLIGGRLLLPVIEFGVVTQLA